MHFQLDLAGNLEKILDTYYRAWFVDFNVMSSAIDGEEHESIKQIAVDISKFGLKFVDSELGPIPKGWEVGNLGDYCDILLGGTPSRNNPEFWDGDLPWINSGKINDFRITSPSEYITSAGLAKSSAKLMPISTTVVAITGATLGQFSRLEIECCANQSVIGIVPSQRLSNDYVYLSIKSDISQLIDKQTGGAQQHINKNDVSTFKLVIPPFEVIQAFDFVSTPIFDNIAKLVRDQ